MITRDQLYVALRTGVASLLSVATLNAIGHDRAFSAIVAVALVTDGVPERTRQRGVQRLLGAVVGTMVGTSYQYLGASNIWLMALAIVTAILLCSLARWPHGMRIAGYLAGILVLHHPAAVWSYALDQFIEIVTGVGFAVLLSLVPYVPIGSLSKES
ncbi:MAG TPA: aromatic acid exporter family protein [Candidatus Polarisedimenticolaceae bacterium]|nr:aromatic acid exporter family protein [Candidatus Polarisedimenticolaceae bacterium]